MLASDDGLDGLQIERGPSASRAHARAGREIGPLASQPVAIRTILIPSRQLDQCSGNPLEAEFEKWTIVDFEQPLGDMDAEIRVDPDQVGIERRMMDFC
jgi:hypothetical protein